MTITASNHGSSVPGRADLLARSEVRRGLEAILRRRLPPQEVEDVAQTVLAAAVASPTLPTDPDELRRWLTRIAQHKIVDFHRGRARSRTLLVDGHPPDAVAASPVAFEEREVLHALLGEKRSQREADTMEWLVREHWGERLADIASENGVPAPVVRQRVSRLRRALRSRWSLLIGVAAVLGGLTAFGFAAHDTTEAIAPDPKMAIPAAPGAPASSPPTDLAKIAEGNWLVQAIRPNRPLSAFEQRLVDLEATNAKVTIHGKRIDLESQTGAFKTSWRITRFEKTERGARLVLVNDTGPVSTADVVLRQDEQGVRLDVALHDRRFGGTLTLRRPVP